ncbi:hypothetical protein BV22DRAFT_787688 [Leucogyrophana mollusca]|uniref:Uncharacterized protein n=1 Tax=Leucogyrophana mollusca TaxID=85980 RepID=A0ACB8B7A0_9AGAM|nr:hypothetical protein BV22DRAFT_787688 [Leucogyrophana mollusca]
MATIEAAVQSMYYDNCFSVVVATVLVYDYLLTIGREDEYVWQRPMSLMSCLYHVGRYLGLPAGVIAALWGNVIRGSVPVSAGFYIFYNLGFYVIVWASAAIMVMRVFAMYNQSKIVLGMLLLFFVPTVIATIVVIAKFFNISSAKFEFVTAIDLLGMNYCAEAPLSRTQTLLLTYLTIPRICFDVLLVVLAVGRLVKDAVDNRVLGKWQPNVYLRILARDSTMYFLLNLAFTLIEIIEPLTTFPAPYQWVAACITDTVPFMLAPHLIISFRYHAKADAIHSGFASHLGTSLGAGEQDICFVTPALTSSMDGRGV